MIRNVFLRMMVAEMMEYAFQSGSALLLGFLMIA